MIDGKTIADEIARQLLSVQPMEGDLIANLYKASKSKEELVAEGYEPVSKIGLMWVKKDEN